MLKIKLQATKVYLLQYTSHYCLDLRKVFVNHHVTD